MKRIEKVMYRTLLVGELRIVDTAFKNCFSKENCLHPAFLPWQWGAEANLGRFMGLSAFFSGEK